MSFNKRIALFAELRPDSRRTDVDAAVGGVVDALVQSIEAAPDVRAARRDVASLLNYLHNLKASRHPGRVRLATALGERVLPLLYEAEAEEDAAAKDGYSFLKEETAVIDRAAEIMGEILSFLRAQSKEHPRYGKQVRDDSIPPLFLFAPEFKEGFRRMLAVLFRAYLRNKHSETVVYKPVRDILSAKGKGDISRYDRQITNLVRTGLDRAREYHRTGKPGGKSPGLPAGNGAETEVTPEQEAARDAFETAHLHAQDNGYFLPYGLDYQLLGQLFTLNKKLVVSGLVALSHAVIQAETENYVIRQIDRLNDTHDLLHFDITVLSAFLYGDKTQRLSYKQVHDACLGAARTRNAMIQMRPLLVAELARRPHQLARRLLALAEDKSVGREDYETLLDVFTRWISDLNGMRFEEEISGCLSQIWGNEILKPITDWVQEGRRDADMAPLAINDVSILRDEIFRR